MTASYKKPLYRLRQALTGKFLARPQPKPMVFLGPGSAGQLSRAIGRFGFKRVLVVTDEPLVKLGALNPTLDALRAAGVEPIVYDGVLPDPTQKVVDDGIDAFQSGRCDAVLAFGGGSSIDAAKVIALASANNCRAADCVGAGKCKLPAKPFFAIPSTAGTGSEGTVVAVISDNETHAKGGVLDASLIPRAAALDPEVMRGLPPQISAATGMDALTHAIESYISRWGNDDSDYYGLAASKLIFDNLATACTNGDDLEAREAMALGSLYGGLAISTALVGYVHAVAHNIGAKYGIAHGLANAMALPHVLQLLRADAQDKLAEIAVHCEMGDASEGNAVLSQKLIDAVQALSDEIGIPRTAQQIKPEDFEELLDAIVSEGASYAAPRFLSRDECRQVLQTISP